MGRQHTGVREQTHLRLPMTLANITLHVVSSAHTVQFVMGSSSWLCVYIHNMYIICITPGESTQARPLQ